MATFCTSCWTPLSGTATHCPACGLARPRATDPTSPSAGDPVGPAAGRTVHTLVTGGRTDKAKRTRSVPGRVAQGTVTEVGTVRQETVVGQTPLITARLGAAATPLALLGVLLARGPVADALLVLGIGLVALLPLGLVLRAALPAGDRTTVTAGALPGGLWPWTLPLRRLSRTRTRDVLPFVVTDLSGTRHRCESTGRFAPSAPSKGDVVDVYGHRGREGVVRVRQVVVTVGGATLRARVGLGVLVTRASVGGAVAVWVALPLALFWLLVVGR